MYRRKDNGSNYIQQFPQLKKWINTCVCCGESGYDPSLPEVLTSSWGQGEIKTVAADHIRKFFKPMCVNELGICEDCQKVHNRY